MSQQPDHLLQPVSAAEAGQKLLQFLERRLSLPQGMLHRWIRTGQIRCNGKRCKPFQHVALGDTVRLPPFALSMAQETLAAKTPLAYASQTATLPSLPPLVYESPDLFVFNKTAGLPVHPGTGHSDSLTTRLSLHHARAPFSPTPAHRLDKDTSGLLLVPRSYAMLRQVQDALTAHGLIKEYLAWVEGLWPLQQPELLRDQLAKRYTGSHEKVENLSVLRTSPENTDPKNARLENAKAGNEAACIVTCLCHCGQAQTQRSLMHIRLLTGKTHQIRVQLSSRGHPLCGDIKYGGTEHPPFKLHAMRIVLPDGQCFEALPTWHGDWQVHSLPPLLTL